MTQPGAVRLAGMATIALVLGTGGAARPPDTPGDSDTLTTAYDVSGLHVIHRFNPATDIVALRLYLLGGTRQLTERTAGIEALLLEASQYGTTLFPGREARHAIARTGADLIVEPERDWTVFGFTALAADLDSIWRPFVDCVMHPTLSEEAVTEARRRLLAGARRRYTQPDQRLLILGLRALFPNHPYSLDPGGTVSSLSGLTADDLRSYHRDQIVSSRMLLAVVGNVTRARVESLVTTTLGRLPHGEYHWTLPPPPERRHSGWQLIEHRPTATSYLLGLFAGPPPTSRDYWAFRVADAALSGLLFQTIRTKRSLSYAAFAPYLDSALPVGGAYVSTPKPDSAFPLIIRQIELLEGPFADDLLLRQFIDKFRFSYLAENATAARQAEFLTHAELYLGSYRKADEFLTRLHGVMPRDIVNVVGQYMTGIQYAYLGDTTRMHGHW